MGDFNIVEHKSDKSGNKKLIRRKEQEVWDNLIFQRGLEDASNSDNLTPIAPYHTPSQTKGTTNFFLQD